MAQQSQHTWTNRSEDTSNATASPSTVGDWMQSVLGPQGQPPSADPQPTTDAQTYAASSGPRVNEQDDSLQSRLAAIARNIETLESKVSGAEPHQTLTAQTQGQTTAVQESAPDPLEALRRRKRALEQTNPLAVDDAPSARPASDIAPDQPEQPNSESPSTLDQQVTSSETDHGQEDHGQDVPPAAISDLVAHLDAQFNRITQAVGDVRALAENSAANQVELQDKVGELQSRLSHRHDDMAPAHDPIEVPNAQNLEQLSDQIRAVQSAIAAMPKSDAIRSLEEGYHHVLARLDTLKGGTASDEKIDALYQEVSTLREALDTLDANSASSLVGEMRNLIAKLENDPFGDADTIVEALDTVKLIAAQNGGEGSDYLKEAIGAVVERLVALEARIEALANGADDSAVAVRLDAIQSEMERLSTFQDEARGLTSAIDTIREEMRAAAPHIDLSGMDQKFSALDRIEEMTGGYADQVANLTQRLAILDDKLSNQPDMAAEVAALTRQMETFHTTIPVREIEQSLLDLTGRVTALQQDDSAHRLGMAVRELGERVEACLKTIPKTDALVESIEAKIETRMTAALEPIVDRIDGVDQRLDGIQRAISASDAPLIDHLSKRLEDLIVAMPTPRADEALASLESQLKQLNARQADAGIVSREEVERLHNELSRARASVELGSNRDLQRAIVDQVRGLADRFDLTRSSGDAALLPDIERQLEDLATRVQSLGLFPNEAPTPMAGDRFERLEQRLESVVDNPGFNALQGELVALREYASDQDQRVHDTLENVQTALETVIRRINALESDDAAASKLAGNLSSASARAPASPSSLDDVAKAVEATPADVAPIPTPSIETKPTTGGEPVGTSSSLPSSSTDAAPEEQTSNHNPAPPVDTPAPGDAQTLLRQLSGAINSTDTEPRRLGGRRSGRATGLSQSQPSVDAANQRASFIAAARRAAQAAALQAGGGAASPQLDPPFARRADSVSTPEADEPTNALDEREEARPSQPRVQDNTDDTVDSKSDHDELTPENAIEKLGGAAKSARKEQKEKQAKEERTQHLLSRAMLVAIVLFTVALGLFVFNLIVPDRETPATIIAPLAPTEAPGEDAETDEVSGAPDTTPRIVGDPLPATSLGNDSAAFGGDSRSDEIETALENPVPAPGAISGGFERDRGPVMAETPEIAADQTSGEPLLEQGLGENDASPVIDAEPSEEPAQLAVDTARPDQDFDESIDPNTTVQQGVAADLGPLLGLELPPLPAATGDALPEAIGSPRLRVAAAGGDPSAAFEVATRFMEGRFVPQDFAAAAHWYGRAADAGIVPAAYRLGSFYEQGRGVDRDRDGAIAWYERAALGGNPRAMHNLAVMAAEGAEAGPDFARAAAWFIPAADRGIPDSQFNLAVLFARGMGVERDLMESYKWFALAANAGDGEAVNRRDEVAGVLGEQALTLARARVENWRPQPVEPLSIAVQPPAGGWDEAPVRADAAPTQTLIAEAQSLLAQRGYDPGPADGLVGPRTSEAVRAFRQSVGLGNSEVIDQALLDALREGTTL